MDFNTIHTVSYTHLDVYKRQSHSVFASTSFIYRHAHTKMRTFFFRSFLCFIQPLRDLHH